MTRKIPNVQKLKQVGSPNREVERAWFLIRLSLQLTIGLMALTAFIQLWHSRDEHGINIAILGLILSLTTVVLLNFYLDQFRAISSALFEFALLLFFTAYRQWYFSAAEGFHSS